MLGEAMLQILIVIQHFYYFRRVLSCVKVALVNLVATYRYFAGRETFLVDIDEFSSVSDILIKRIEFFKVNISAIKDSLPNLRSLVSRQFLVERHWKVRLWPRMRG